MRLTAGYLKGRRLLTPEDRTVTRPTLSRARETIFDYLAGRVQGARFLDLCAGSGAVGFEALSRGAATVIWVERDRRAASCIRKNFDRCGLDSKVGSDLTSSVRLIQADARAALRRFHQEGGRFDLIYLDPPYASTRLRQDLLEQLATSDLLAPSGLILFEADRLEIGALPFEVQERAIGGGGSLFCLQTRVAKRHAETI